MYYISTNQILIKKKLFTYQEILVKRKTQSIMKHYRNSFYLPINKFDLSVFYYKCGLIFIPNPIVKNIENKDFIDGGAYIGDSALVFEKFYNPHKIYAFEPELINYNQMLETIEKNNLNKIIPIRKGLGEKDVSLKVIFQGSCSYISDTDGEEINITTIDKLVFDENLNVGLIHLDVEGFGLKTLKGAYRTIKKFKPILLIAIYHNGEEFFEIIQYIDELKINYKYIFRKLNPNNPYFETYLIAW
ncbi:MAG: FkbM family methyltransferase [Promethearchaeota archaeon]